MKLWLLKRVNDDSIYDALCSVVVRARTEKGARWVATTEKGDECAGDDDFWHGDGVTCEELTPTSGPVGSVCVNFLHG